jgi:hypothetical protein
MEFKKSFKEYLNKVAKYDATKYIGAGNPNAEILIISKEILVKSDEQYDREITKNHYNWVNNIQTEDLVIGEYPADDYNPMFPYKGKLLKAERGGHTWRKYQKLCDLIYEKDEKKVADKFDFQNTFFLTEINSTQDDKATNYKRKDMFGELDFFKQFKVIIIDGLSSYDIKKREDKPTNEIEFKFNVRYNEMREPVDKQRFWIFNSPDNKRTIIQTGKLNGKNLADEYITELAAYIQDCI